MSREQKLVLAVLALANVLVIGGMVAYVISQSRGPAGQPPPSASGEVGLVDSPPAASPCADYLIESLRWLGGTTKVSILDEGIIAEGSFDAPAHTPPNRPEVSPQALWTMLDSLSPAFSDICGTPNWMILTARFTVTSTPKVFTIQVPGDQLALWLEGLLDDRGLTSEAHYRASLPGADQPMPAPAP